ncbi:MAG: DUF6112 family protein [Candidatus Pacebacteria bacterium]|nr:DUF6112 family protein [Candidatus Paceibacterota bacterium]MDD3729267.1 DUF6112 family protein [Candidatus Paceibacterota bacterium]MDD4201496.1 DUF6112 family protein [Candidatus Paceibacterota bacterium]MDD5446126.1 DUF6112 family protein [Candidatus Paceibacterota bacterium]
MKKIALSVFALSLLIAPFALFAAGTYQPLPTSGSVAGILESLMTLANWLFSFLLVAGVIGIVVSGYLFVSSAGDATKAASARQMVIYSLVGVLVGGLGVILVNWVVNEIL